MNNREKAKLALKHRLYSQPTWCMIDDLRECVKYPDDFTIELAFKGDKPVGVAILDKRCKMLQVFTRKAERGHGIGSALVRKVKVEGSWGSAESPSNGRIFEYNGVEAR